VQERKGKSGLGKKGVKAINTIIKEENK